MNETYHGKRNLICLGAGALLITCLTTCLSLWIYRTSGDIYLDRSRPGYLPDEEEVEQNTQTDKSFTFSDTGELNRNELTSYLKELKKVIDRIDALETPYAPGPLSDESLGIPVSDHPEDAPQK